MWFKKHRFIIIFLAITIIFVGADIFVIVWSNSQKLSDETVNIDLKKYVVVNESGFSTEGKVGLDFKYDNMTYDILRNKKIYPGTSLYGDYLLDQDKDAKPSIFPFINSALRERWLKAGNTYIAASTIVKAVTCDKKEGLKNGDTIRIKCHINHYRAKEFDLKLSNIEFDYKVGKLKKGEIINPFKDCVVTAEVDYDVHLRTYALRDELKIRNKKYHELSEYYQLAEDDYSYDYYDSEYHDGDYVKVEISDEDKETIKKNYGYLLTKDSKRIKIKVTIKNKPEETTMPAEWSIPTEKQANDDGYNRQIPTKRRKIDTGETRNFY